MMCAHIPKQARATSPGRARPSPREGALRRIGTETAQQRLGAIKRPKPMLHRAHPASGTALTAFEATR